MPRSAPDPVKEREQKWLNDAAVLKVGWVWWLVLVSNMGLFAWGLQAVDRYSLIPISCVWLGAFSCCMIFHVESIKRVLALRSEVEELRRALTERDGPHDVYSSR
jgi:hypothetical protein